MTWPAAGRPRAIPRPLAVAVLAALSCALLVACNVACNRGPAPPPDRPHVLLVSLDTLRADRVGSYGHDRDTTPFLDRLAAEGTRFESAFINTHGTPPSHATLFTSLYQLSHGVSVEAGDGSVDHHLPETLPILPQVLKDAGWQTVAVTGGGFMSKEFGWQRGFDAFAEQKLEAGAERLARLIESRLHDGQPIFAFLHTYEVHSPYDPPPPYPNLWGELEAEVDASSAALKARSHGKKLSDAERESLLKLYDAGIRYTDDVLARLFERLEAAGFLEHALIVVTSDHGEEFGEHGGLLHPATLYDELVAVPLIVKGPGVPAGRVDSRLVSLIDVAPTIYGYLGVRPPRLASGIDLLAKGSPGRPQVFFQYGDLLHGVRTDQLKLIENRRTGQVQFFDLAIDPGEQRNLARRRPLMTEELGKRLENWRATTPRLESLRRGSEQISDEKLEELRALGYVD